jgi:multiple sugar transport system ATP-binding protein
MARVELEQVSKLYPGGVRAVDRLDLSIADQEFVVLVGPSGCGKSTTLRMVAGLEELSSGTIRIGDRIVNHIPPKDRDVAMVFQNYALYPHMTVRQNMEFALRLRKVPRPQRQQRVLEAAKTLEIVHLLNRRPAELSGGQRQRVAVGRAIVREPAAFLFDEPLSNLDAKLRVSTRAELKRLHHRLRTTTIYVTHDQEEAMTLGDRIVVMKDGVIQQAAAPLSTYHYPVNRFVAGFIGMPPMNFFNGLLLQEAGGLVFAEVAHKPASDGAFQPAAELTLPANGFRLPVSPAAAPLLKSRVGRSVVLGVRPEHLHLRADAAEATAPLEVTVSVIEPLGSDMDVYMKTNLHDSVVARVKSLSGLATDARATFYVDLAKVHFFEPGETGMNLSLEPSVKTVSSKAPPATESAHALA